MSIFNPSQLIADAVNAGFDPGVVSDIDERQLPWAKNVLSWIVDSEFLNTKMIFPVQLQVLLRLFGDVCPYCSDWEFYCTDWDVSLKMGDILDKIELLSDGKCKKCHKTRFDHFNDKLWIFPDELDLCWGMRSGKSAIGSGIAGSYVLHRYLRLPNPADYFEQLKGQELFMRFIAITQKQAKDSNWMHFKRSVQNCDWFSQYHSFLDHHGKKKGMELVKWLNEHFAYIHKGIVGYVQGAADDTSRGRTSIFSSIDEIGWFSGTKDSKRANPDETYLAYEASSATIRNMAFQLFKRGDYNVPTAWMVVHSSTKSKNDYMMRLLKRGKTNFRKITSHKASWEVNAQLDQEYLEGKKLEDPKAFMRDFGSIPPFAEDPFIDNEELVLKAAVLDKPHWPVKVSHSQIGSYLDASGLERQKTIPYCLSIDMGQKDCGYALTLLQLKEEDPTVVQLAGAWSIYPKKPFVVDLDGMFEHCIKTFCEKLNIKLVLFDQWQSSTQIDTLKKMDVDAQQYSLVFSDFTDFRTRLYQAKFEAVKPELTFSEVENSSRETDTLLAQHPYVHLLWQMLSVSEIGQKLTKGDGHDDVFRACVLGSTFLWKDKYRHLFEHRGGVYTGKKNKKGLVISGGSRGGNPYQINSQSHHATSVRGRTIGIVVPRNRR